MRVGGARLTAALGIGWLASCVRRSSPIPGDLPSFRREGGPTPALLLASAGEGRLAVGGRAEAGGEKALGRP